MKKSVFSDELKWSVSYLKPYFLGLFGIFILVFGENYSMAMLPKVSTNFLFELITPEKIHLLLKYFYIAVGLIFARALFNFLERYSMRIITVTVTKKIRDNFFQQLLTLDIDFFTSNKTGNLITIGVNDVENIRIDFYQGIINFFSNIMMTIIILVKLFLLNWTLTLISLAMLPVLYLVVRIIGNKMRIISRKLRKSLSNVSINLHETLTGMEVVKSFAKEKEEYESFKDNTTNYKKTFLRLVRLEMIFSPINDVIIYMYGILLVGIGAIFIIRGTWDVKHLTEYLMLLGILSGPVIKIPRFISNYKIVTASIERVLNILKTEPRVQETENPVDKKIEGSMAFDNVFFSYDGENDVMNGIRFEVKKGDIIALVGPSGAGKSTIANLIPRFYDCDSGSVLVDGINVKEYRLASLRSQIGIVSQNVILFNTTITENIRYSKRDATEDEIVKAARQAYAYDFIMELPKKFETNVGEKGIRLSGGQKQRISIARTILMNPQILILDEATSSLDSESEHFIQLAINNLMKGRTSVIIAHRLSTIKHATRILVIDRGRIVDTGNHDELIKRCELYQRIYNLQYFR